MKDFYTIKEFASLYDVSTDALRYYEKQGLIFPKRGENSYRLYSLQDVYRLTIIRDMLEIGFSTAKIGEYLKSASLESSEKLLIEEQEVISRQISKLKAIEETINRRRKIISDAREVVVGEIRTSYIKKRSALRLSTDIRRDEEVDLAIKKLHSRYTSKITDLGGQYIGAEMTVAEVSAGEFGHYHSVFFLLENLEKSDDTDYCDIGDISLPEGEYISIVYKGSYRKGKEAATRLLCEIEKMGRAPMGLMLELYHIDNRHTTVEEEFLTELQVMLL